LIIVNFDRRINAIPHDAVENRSAEHQPGSNRLVFPPAESERRSPPIFFHSSFLLETISRRYSSRNRALLKGHVAAARHSPAFTGLRAPMLIQRRMAEAVSDPG
jgi:hypothetical protein